MKPVVELPFGIAATPAVFQRTMDTVLHGLSGVVCYVDDIIVTGKDSSEHLSNLKQESKNMGFMYDERSASSCKIHLNIWAMW